MENDNTDLRQKLRVQNSRLDESRLSSRGNSGQLSRALQQVMILEQRLATFERREDGTSQINQILKNQLLDTKRQLDEKELKLARAEKLNKELKSQNEENEKKLQNMSKMNRYVTKDLKNMGKRMDQTEINRRVMENDKSRIVGVLSGKDDQIRNLQRTIQKLVSEIENVSQEDEKARGMLDRSGTLKKVREIAAKGS